LVSSPCRDGAANGNAAALSFRSLAHIAAFSCLPRFLQVDAEARSGKRGAVGRPHCMVNAGVPAAAETLPGTRRQGSTGVVGNRRQDSPSDSRVPRRIAQSAASPWPPFVFRISVFATITVVTTSRLRIESAVVISRTFPERRPKHIEE
jgi:hypothetical protein